MHEYDIALKVLLQASASAIIRQLTGGLSVDRWLNAEMPQVRTGRADLLGLTLDGLLLHFELQSTNDPDMPLRMLEYALLIYRVFGKFPKQIVLYVGERPLRMSADWVEPDLRFHYTLIDVRELDSAALLESSNIGDNLLAVLTGLQDQVATVRLILKRIADLDEPARRDAFAQFLIISGLRRLAPVIREEAKKMPILDDIMDHEVIGPAIREGLEKGLKQGLQEGRQKGLQEGLQEGLQKGLQKGLQEGRSEMLMRQLEKRFGMLPEWAASRLSALSVSELDDVALRIFDAQRLEDLV